MSKKHQHRGRLQAQGEGLEASESWAQDEPLTARKGLRLLGRLKRKIGKKEAEKRREQFARAEDLIRRLEKDGGIDARFSESFRKKGTKGVRIDIEVLSGRAFVALLFFAIALYWLLQKLN